MSYSPEFLEEMKKRLQKEKTELESELSKMGKKHGTGYEPKFPEDGEHSDENAQEVTEYLNEVPLTNTLETQLEKVNVALKKMEGGNYGQKGDGSFVPEERLEANPAAGALIEE